VRWSISAVALLGWLAARRNLGSVGPLLTRQGWTVAWVAGTGVTLFYFLENLALRYTTATNAGVLANLTSVFMVLIATIWLRERLRPSEWLALVIAFAGAALVSQGAGHLTLVGPGLTGDLLMIVATFFGAIYSIGGKRLVATYPAEAVTALVAAVGALFLLPLALWEMAGGFGMAETGIATGFGQIARLPLIAWAALLLLGLGAGALANVWWLHLLNHTTTSRAGMVLFLVPVISTILSVVALHEPLTLGIIAGGVLVLGGIAATQRYRA
jgi:drug/metabolite transporter (DMT)-like permease